MKKYLMIGFAAVAFAACSNHDFETYSQEQIIQNEYKANFVAEFGQPASNHTWGFGSAFTRANTTYGYNETSDGINANANEWADIKNSTGFGGWIVPAPLTPDQKALVARYFQSVKDLDYKDPEWSDFFVQQVYKGGNTKKYETTEGIIAANGTSAYTSDNMNLLTVGSNPEHHINNFNGGSYGVEAGSGYGTEGATGVSVLDNGSDILAGKTSYHNDQIMLMLNIEDTHCMGYHCSATGESGFNSQRNDKAALVSWQKIAQWQVDNGDITDINQSILNDTWNRSFVGFDLALKPFDECVVKDNSGNVQYAALSNISACPNYVWDGENVMKIGTASAATGSERDITSNFLPASWDPQNREIVDGKLVFTATQWATMTASFDKENMTSYTKLVFQLDNATTCKVKVSINAEVSGATYDVISQEIEAGATEIEIALTGADFSQVKGISLQAYEAATLTFSKIYLEGSEAYEYYGNTLLVKDANGNDMQIPFLARNTNQYAGHSRTLTDADLKITPEGSNVECLNLALIQELVDNGYYPTSSDLKEWSTWEDGDGYYSDWIVTLHKAERVPTTSVDYQGRIMVEDLSAKADVTGKDSDWDFNDVVFDWAIIDGKAHIRLLAAGGTLPIRIGGTRNDASSEPVGSVEIHNSVNGLGGYMKNCGVGDEVPYKEFVLEDHTYTDARNILITVYKGGSWVEIQAEQGQPAAKFNCKVGTKWCDEYVNIQRVYPDFKTWVANPATNWEYIDANGERLTDKDLTNNAAE